MSGLVRLLRRLLHDRSGASMVEFAIVFPIFASVALGTVDLSYVLYQSNAAAKATQRGTREAAVSDPIAVGLNNFTSSYWTQEPYNLHIGKPCSAANGTALTDNCPTFDVTCTNTTCSAKWGHSATAFKQVYDVMNAVFPMLKPENVEVRYRSSGLGFAGRPGGLPVEVSVRIRCMRQELFFLGGLANVLGHPAPQGCAAIPAGTRTWIIPESAYTLITEDLCWHRSKTKPTCDAL